ncbi:phosphonate metabolism protein/1,5-bisphosphokinase (PRPP-forming) PhnN [Microbacterium amylolyticum]|uniref:Ribose 1,5-bisphosphate phosphokinase PhnN n=1 Tax=Microbacterium amylolyticum TaxID=936337 RepID=A0ABS4ZG75_9MICO|nr:phosphonate metabolism protein/1,5-bisphosphokinase (PRPP-forming) PhnN [Microbacterium amylolyticum]MBP2436281.1 ribose 1,5-bisphosphokinase [Microbacterium amylolyticum]
MTHHHSGGGVFVAITGPSGCGKDAVMRAVSDTIGDNGESGIVFPRRVITRAPEPGEDHEAVAEEEFRRREQSGAFALTWRAHGLAYGIPVCVADQVDQGRIAVVNTSRAVLDDVRSAFPVARAVRVTAPTSVCRDRIFARGRENADAAERRLAREDPAPHHPFDLVIENTGTLDDAAERLSAFLLSLRGEGVSHT